MSQEDVYDLIIVSWTAYNGECELAMRNTSLSSVRDRAIRFGFVPPVWYKPWQRDLTIVVAEKRLD
jgi:hypothetical protein